MDPISYTELLQLSQLFYANPSLVLLFRHKLQNCLVPSALPTTRTILMSLSHSLRVCHIPVCICHVPGCTCHIPVCSCHIQVYMSYSCMHLSHSSIHVIFLYASVTYKCTCHILVCICHIQVYLSYSCMHLSNSSIHVIFVYASVTYKYTCHIRVCICYIQVYIQLCRNLLHSEAFYIPQLSNSFLFVYSNMPLD